MRPLLAIFAHPDDEAFGPAGFIALEARKRDVHLVCVTNGAAGKNSLEKKSHSVKKELTDIRTQELRKSASILGVKSITFLGYEDGSLANNIYHEIATKIDSLVISIKPEILLTYEPKGISGHLDHIAVSMISSFVFRENRTVSKIFYYAVPEDRQEQARRETYFIFYPKGYKSHEMHLCVKTDSVWDLKKRAMFAHASQKHDSAAILDRIEKLPKEEHFIIESR